VGHDDDKAGYFPRTIHQVWIGSALPPLMERWAKEWRRLHPGWNYRLWGARDLVAEWGWDNLDLMQGAARYAPSRQGQFVSDILRLEVLFRFGGVYVDTDTQPLRTLEQLLSSERLEWRHGHVAFLAWESPGWLNNGVMGATGGHPWLRALLSDLRPHVEALHAQGVRTPNKLTGPQFLTEPTLAAFLTDGAVQPLPRDYFHPYLYTQVADWDPEKGADYWRERFPGSYCVHHWNNRRREHGERVDGGLSQ
jgi:mannosyltransferase OCH1-like enzyme